MEHYWISPAGQLFIIDYAGVSDWEPDDSNKFWPYKRVPNGNHGKVTPVLKTGDVTVYSSKGDDMYESTILFLRGKIVEVLPEVKWIIPNYKTIQLTSRTLDEPQQTGL